MVKNVVVCYDFRTRCIIANKYSKIPVLIHLFTLSYSCWLLLSRLSKLEQMWTKHLISRSYMTNFKICMTYSSFVAHLCIVIYFCSLIVYILGNEESSNHNYRSYIKQIHSIFSYIWKTINWLEFIFHIYYLL